MEGRPTTAESKHNYQTNLWQRAPSSSFTPALNANSQPASGHFPPELLPLIFPQQTSVYQYQAQLLEYNKLIAPGRGGGVGGPHASPISPASLSPINPPTLRHRSSSKALGKDGSQPKSGQQSCHGNKPAKNTENTDRDRALIAPAKEQPKMSGKKQLDSPPLSLGSRQGKASHSDSAAQSTSPPLHASSVPSTPHQHTRKFSFESRQPSPPTQNHSPRSAYSETNGNVPSLRPLPSQHCRFETAVPFSRRRMPYSIGTDRLETIDPEKVKSMLTDDEERKLDMDMRKVYDRLLPTPEVEKNRQRLVQKLEKLFNDEWPGHDIRVHLFGSSGNLLCSDDSDVDICITTEWKELEGVCMIAELLARHGMEKVVCVSSARVPIVKIWDPELGLACDMNVNNTLALENTRMVRTYVDIDPRVRPLAMIVKYWTRRRVVNDAAFGGTLSSYTWICMIIAFLQLRDPPILPALHTRNEEKLRNKDGKKSQFADDLDKLRGFGGKNTDNLGALLFQFFRFYAHEFDYDKHVLSIRLGKLVSKTEKGWHITTNNMLCVEEPFNTVRNLGNTADDTSFRGIHQELRRAFDLIAAVKFEECCEQYEFPKEEDRSSIFQRRDNQPRPALLRSSSQHQQSNRGGRGGGYRGRGQYRNNNNNRRASNVAYDPNTNPTFVQGMQQAGVPAAMSQQEILWYQAQNPQLSIPLEMFNQMGLQVPDMRLQMYTQQQALAAAAQRLQAGAAHATDRSRTNSFDNPPLSAPLRPEFMINYGYPMQTMPYYPQSGGFTYPSSPSSTTTPTAGSEFRRSLHRGTATSESGATSGSGTLRSQSQPASRTPMPPVQAVPGFPGSARAQGAQAFPSRQNSGIPISFTSDEAPDAEFDDLTPKPLAESPQDEDQYIGYFVNGAPNVGGPPNVLAFGDAPQLGQPSRRRPSADQSPQTILDRRMRRTSRSPSPLGHARAFSVGTSSAPLASAPFAQTGGKLAIPTRAPVVVNGSGSKSIPSSSVNRPVMTSDAKTMEDSSFDNPLHINQGVSMVGAPWSESPIAQQMTPVERSSPPFFDRPVVANGLAGLHPPSSKKNVPDPASFQHRLAMMSMPGGTGYAPLPGERQGLAGFSSANGRSRVISRQQQSGTTIAPLDLATGDFTLAQEHLSPVYEHRTPSPTFVRKFEPPVVVSSTMSRAEMAPPAPPVLSVTQKQSQTSTPPRSTPSSYHLTKQDSSRSPASDARLSGFSRENGNARPAKSQNDTNGGWQKPKSRKKGGEGKHLANGYGHSELPPKNDADRKGG